MRMFLSFFLCVDDFGGAKKKFLQEFKFFFFLASPHIYMPRDDGFHSFSTDEWFDSIIVWGSL
jgi:hypothetical protein